MADAQAKSIHKYSDIVKEITGNRLDKYSILSELEFCLEKRYANNINDVWKIDDAYVTLSMAYEIENKDIQHKIQDRISKIK